jgi:hypothetical protein
LEAHTHQIAQVAVHKTISLDISITPSSTVSYHLGLIAIEAKLAVAHIAAHIQIAHKSGNKISGTAIATARTQINFHQVFKFSIELSLKSKIQFQTIS